MNIKKTSFSLFFIFNIIVAFSQTSYMFEGTSAPTNWSASKGTFSISTEKVKQGTRSLKWEVIGNSDITITPTSTFNTSSSNCFYFQLFSKEVTNDTLTVQLLNSSGAVSRSFKVLMNFKGWREVCRYHTEYSSSSSVTIKTVKLKLNTSDTQNQRDIYFDSFYLTTSKPTSRYINNIWVLDYEKITASDRFLFNYYNIQQEIDRSTATQAELNALTTFRNISALKLAPSVGTATELQSAKDYVTSLNIVRNSDGSITGTSVGLRTINLTDTYMTSVTRNLEVLAADASSQDLFNNLLDHLIEQGFAEGLPYYIPSNNYTLTRNIPNSLFGIIPKCNVEQKKEVIKLLNWLIRYGNVNISEKDYLYNINSDLMYNYAQHYMRLALNYGTEQDCVEQMRAFKRFMDRYSQYTPGDLDMLKPDGTGFHHMTHFNNYMYAYRSAMQYMSYLAGTPYRVERDSYERYKKAYISYYLMMTLDTGDNQYMPLSLSGRTPSSLSGSVNKAGFENMIKVGDDLYGTDLSARGYYNAFYKSSKYSPADVVDLKGFYAFNYSPLAIYRGNGWVASMRSPTTKFWGAEIYSSSNRFGRYQSHGTLEVMYDGSLSKSGYPTFAAGGWDWNMPQGTTTVHYKSWSELMPNKNTSDRFDQLALTTDFAGALAWEKVGLFAADFDQIDTWGAQRFTPTNLVYKKSVLAVDNMLISIGSDISSSGSYDNSMNTATNIFQNIITSNVQPFYVNSVETTSSPLHPLQSNVIHNLITPAGTGYIFPTGNDPIYISYGTQSSPIHTGSDVANPTTTVTAAKAYFDHGVKPSNKGYEMIVIPATTQQQVNYLAQEKANGMLYSVLEKSSQMHVIHYKPKNIHAYTFFQAVSNINHGIIRSITSEALVMYKPDEINLGKANFAIVNPNLKPSSNTRGNWVETETVLQIQIEGAWEPELPDGITVISNDNNTLTLEVRLSHGMAKFFSLKDKSLNINNLLINRPNITFERDRNILSIDSKDIKEISIFNTSSQMIYNDSFSTPQSNLKISNLFKTNGVYIVSVLKERQRYLQKIIY